MDSTAHSLPKMQYELYQKQQLNTYYRMLWNNFFSTVPNTVTKTLFMQTQQVIKLFKNHINIPGITNGYNNNLYLTKDYKKLYV